MLLGQIFQSINAWKKLSAVNMKPKLAYKVLKYTKKVSAEYDIAEKQRVALIHEVTGTKEGEEAKIEPDSPEIAKYVEKFNEIMLTESTLSRIDLELGDVVDAVDEKDETFTVSDLALLEPFFKDYVEPVAAEEADCASCNMEEDACAECTPKTELEG